MQINRSCKLNCLRPIPSSPIFLLVYTLRPLTHRWMRAGRRTGFTFNIIDLYEYIRCVCAVLTVASLIAGFSRDYQQPHLSSLSLYSPVPPLSLGGMTDADYLDHPLHMRFRRPRPPLPVDRHKQIKCGAVGCGSDVGGYLNTQQRDCGFYVFIIAPGTGHYMYHCRVWTRSSDL